MVKPRTQKKHRKLRSVKSRTPTPYPRAILSQSYMNVTQTWKNGVGRRNTVMIRNGKGIKRVEEFGTHGKIKEQTRKLTGAEKEQILQGQFIPGLWRNCRIGSC
jgi:hypothetical protein